MTHGLSELTASTVRVRLTPLTVLKKKKRRKKRSFWRTAAERSSKCINKRTENQNTWKALMQRWEMGTPAVVSAYIHGISIAICERTLKIHILKLYCKTEVPSSGPSGLVFSRIFVPPGWLMSWHEERQISNQGGTKTCRMLPPPSPPPQDGKKYLGMKESRFKNINSFFYYCWTFL